MGLAILGVAFILALLVSWLVARQVHSEAPQPLPEPTQAGLVGFPAHFDALSATARARDLSVRPWLFGIVLDGVRSDGTLELTEQGAPGSARFVFGSRRGEGPQPPVPPGERRRRDHCGRQEVIIDQRGIHAAADQDDHDCKGLSKGLPDPSCDPAQVWQRAIAKGAPKDRLARLEFFNAKAGPAWRFRILGTDHELTLYGDCGEELAGVDAKGHVP
jgi:hypothetical protein